MNMATDKTLEAFDQARLAVRLKHFQDLSAVGLEECYVATYEVRGVTNIITTQEVPRVTICRRSQEITITVETRSSSVHDTAWRTVSRRSLADEEWKAICRLIAEARFWELPSRDAEASAVMGGDAWTIEGYADGRYHFVYRCTGSDAAIYALGETLARLAGSSHIHGE
jgi:hypothetical protein